ncbi:MAG: hypothetical protein WBV71_15310 [Roseobacter sp.]
MTSNVTYSAYTADKLRTAQAECNKAPWGQKRNDAKQLYERALKAHHLRRDAHAIELLDSLMEMLAD